MVQRYFTHWCNLCSRSRNFHPRIPTPIMKLDPALIELLSLDPANTTISSHGGGGMSSASTYKLTTKLLDGSEKKYFIKTGRGADAAVMFAGPMPPILTHARGEPGPHLTDFPRRACFPQRHPRRRPLPLPLLPRSRRLRLHPLDLLPRHRRPRHFPLPQPLP